MAAVTAALTLLPVFAESSEIAEVASEDVKTVSFEDDGSADEAFAGYVNSVFYNDSAAYSTGLRTAGSLLEGDEKAAYDALVPIIKEIASGERSSSVIHIGKTVNTGSGLIPVDGEAVFTGTFEEFDLTELIMALLSDMPYDLYWYDKVSGGSAGGYTYNNGTAVHIILYLSVSDKFSGSAEYTLDTSKTGATVSAAQNAQAIVSEYADNSDFEKLTAYKNEICDLVVYNDDAADGGDPYYFADSDPWQMIYVFDGDDSTNVVCEGYSKAFQYLCDATVFQSSAIQCYSVTGTLLSGSKGGGHMWNTVTMPDGKNYLVDVTNSDGAPDTSRDLLFFKGMKSEIRPFSVEVDGEASTADLECYVYYVGEQAIIYLYDDLTKNFWGDDSNSILNLSENDYNPVTFGDSNGDSSVDPMDLANMQRYIAGWSGYDDDSLDSDGMDVNSDGRVNPLDVIILARHIAKWIGYETLPYNP